MLTLITYGAAAVIHDGLELEAKLAVDAALWRVASIAIPPKAEAIEAQPKQLAATGPVPAPVKKPVLAKPAQGIDWGIIHGNNGVDIANKCGTTVSAAADGVVTEIGAGWNGGYGNSVLIKHSNGTKTHYAHLSEVMTRIGAEVVQGDEIGLMGITGKSTGCHLHFEVRGGINPFGK